MNPVPLVRKAQFIAHSVFRSKTATLDGATISTDQSNVDRAIRKATILGDYERPERETLRSILTPSDRVLDLGTCAGVVAVIAANVVGEKNVLCYEPNKAMEPVIRKNFSLNGMTNPKLRMKAATIDGRDVRIGLPKRPFSTSMYDRGDERSVEVGSDRLRDILMEFKPTIVLMDVEGAEVELFTEPRLMDVRAIVAELHPHIVGREATKTCIEIAKAAGFKAHSQRELVHLFAR